MRGGATHQRDRVGLAEVLPESPPPENVTFHKGHDAVSPFLHGDVAEGRGKGGSLSAPRASELRGCSRAAEVGEGLVL